jgi:hypothetical protein
VSAEFVNWWRVSTIFACLWVHETRVDASERREKNLSNWSSRPKNVMEPGERQTCRYIEETGLQDAAESRNQRRRRYQIVVGNLGHGHSLIGAHREDPAQRFRNRGHGAMAAVSLKKKKPEAQRTTPAGLGWPWSGRVIGRRAAGRVRAGTGGHRDWHPRASAKGETAFATEMGDEGVESGMKRSQVRNAIEALRASRARATRGAGHQLVNWCRCTAADWRRKSGRWGAPGSCIVAVAPMRPTPRSSLLASQAIIDLWTFSEYHYVRVLVNSLLAPSAVGCRLAIHSHGRLVGWVWQDSSGVGSPSPTDGPPASSSGPGCPCPTG